MMVVRDIVRRHGRLPGTLVLDNGAEFKSGAFQRVCELYEVTVRYRPAAHPRHGCVIERVFGTTHSQLIHNLAGNTKQLKHVRTVTKSVAPERHAEWTLPALYGALNKFFQDIYGTEAHPAHADAPDVHLRTRLAETGLRRHRLVRLDRTFLIETCPPVDRTGERKIDPKRGVKINHLWYWSEAFRPLRREASVPVRIDPWDARVRYVLLGQAWHQCVSKLVMGLRRLTCVELESYFEEMTQKRGIEKQDLTPERIREWMQVLDKNAFDQRLQSQQTEARLIYDALKLTSVDPAPPGVQKMLGSPDHHDVDLPSLREPDGACPDHDIDTPVVAVEDDEYGLY